MNRTELSSAIAPHFYLVGTIGIFIIDSGDHQVFHIYNAERVELLRTSE